MINFLENLLLTNIIWTIWAGLIFLLLVFTKRIVHRDRLNLMYLSFLALPILFSVYKLSDFFAVEINMPEELQFYEAEAITVVSTTSEQIVSYVPFIYLICGIGLAYIIYNLFQLFKHDLKKIDAFDSELNTLKEKANIRMNVAVYSSKIFNSPMSFGWMKKRIIIPEATLSELSEEKIRFILLHELLHLKNHDFMKNIFQKLTRVLFFYNPLIILMDKYIDKHREFACDDDLISILPEKKAYASTLLDLHQEDMLNVAMAHQFIGSKHILKQRIQQMTAQKKKYKTFYWNYSILILTSFIIIACQDKLIENDVSNAETLQFFDVTEKPQIIKKVLPKYPERARAEGVQGMVVVDFIVNEKGEPTELKVLKGNPMLDDAALTAIEQYRFNPGKMNGKIIKVNWRVPIRFRLTSGADDNVLNPENYKAPIGDEERMKFHVGDYVDKKPVVIKKVTPIYPEEAKKKFIEGTVTVKFSVDKNGIPIMIRASGPKDLWEAAKQAVLGYRFEPGIKDGKKVNVNMSLPIRFVLHEDDSPYDIDANNEGRVIYNARHLKNKPELIKSPLPVYPKEASKKGIEGKVLVDFFIEKDGTTSDVSVSEFLRNPDLDQAAIDAVKKYLFKPVMVDGKIVRVRMFVPIVFKLK